MRRIVLITLALAGLAAATHACASAPRGAPSRDRDVLTAAEIANVSVITAYEAVQRLRPEFLRTRGRMSLENPDGALPAVYVDNVPHGAPEALRSIRAADVYEIRFYSAADATTRFGTGHAGGVIALTTHRGNRSGTH